MQPTRLLPRFGLSALLLLTSVSSAQAQNCGGSFSGFLQGIANEAAQKGHSQAVIQRFLRGAQQDQAVLRADRAQGIFQKDFLAFSRALISADRKRNAARYSQKYNRIFNDLQRRYGVPRGLLLAFWAFETDFGQVQGSFNTRNALLTLAHDCRRPELFRPQVFAAMTLAEEGVLDPARTTGAWAGEIGMVQMLPGEVVAHGVDGDGDGKVDLEHSVADALHSSASALQRIGWRANEPWMQEVTLPADLNWADTGLHTRQSVADWRRAGVRARHGSLGADRLSASILLPMGRKGPAFIVYPNFSALFKWNKSLVYVTTAAYFATRIEGAPIYDAGNPPPALSGEQVLQLQRKLSARGHDVGGIDGIIGAMTRAAVQKEQQRLGLPADAWPTRELLSRL